MATIYDVAKTAGVSPKTVSRVLNRDAPVAAKTRDAVEAAMTQLGYVPSFAARSCPNNSSLDRMSLCASSTLRTYPASSAACCSIFLRCR